MRRTPPPRCPRGRTGGARPTKPGWFLQQTKSFTVDIRAKPEYHKFLIGKGGGKIRKVRDSTGARIVFPAAEDREQDLITIIGKEDAVREAQRELEALIQNLDNVVEDCMLVDPKHHRHFVIRRGQVLREIAEEYGGVMVSFPRSGTQSDKVTLKGAKDCVEAAKKRIQEIIEDLVGAQARRTPGPDATAVPWGGWAGPLRGPPSSRGGQADKSPASEGPWRGAGGLPYGPALRHSSH